MSGALIFLIALVAICVIGVLVQLLLIIGDRGRQRKWQEHRALATVLKISMVPGVLLDRWYVTVAWSERNSGNVYTFSGSPSTFRPKLRVGEKVRIAFDENQPENFRILDLT